MALNCFSLLSGWISLLFRLVSPGKGGPTWPKTVFTCFLVVFFGLLVS